MPKQKRELGEHPLRKSASLAKKSRQPPSSARVHIDKARDEKRSQALPSPSPSNPPGEFHRRQSLSSRGPKKLTGDPAFGQVFEPTQNSGTVAGRKRKNGETLTENNQRRSRLKLVESPAVRGAHFARKISDIEYWSKHGRWPETFSKRISTTLSESSVLYGQMSWNMSQDNSSKRKSESTHRSDKLERMAENGVFMKSSALLQKSSRNQCRGFSEGDRIPLRFPCFPAEKVPDVIDRVDGLNEGRIQRDITPWVVPSAENLYLCGELDLDYIGDEVQAEWTRCATMGGTRPKPDFTAGVLRKAFSKDEIQKLRNHASPMKPFFFTPELCFPFLACEAKNGEEGLNKANRQNIHSASLAVRAIIELFWAAFGKTHARVEELYGKILVFTVSHNSSQANIYGHYAVVGEASGQLEFYRYDIAMYSLSMNEGVDRFKPYNFIYNIYEKFAPEHLKRIKDAAARLPISGMATGLSFTTSELDLQADAEPGSQEASLQEYTGFRKPALPASALHKRELDLLKEQIDQQHQNWKEQMEQIEQQRQDWKEQMEQLRQDSKEREAALQRQLEEQQKEIISLLSKKPME